MCHSYPTLSCCVLCLAAACSASAEIYKSVDPDGVTRYSDMPAENAEEFVPPSMNAIPMPEWQPPPPPEPEAEAFAYDRLAIARPSPEQTIISNQGILEVVVSITPGLAPGHTLELLVDGNVAVRRSEQLEHRLVDIDRGTHLIQARVRGDDGRLLKSSTPVRIFMKRFSRLQGGGAAPGPRDRAGEPYTPGPQDPRYQSGARPPAS